jgi:hypothetical protein
MNPRFRKVAVFVGAAAVAGAVGVGVATQGGEASGGTQAGMTRQVGGPGAMDVGALARALGVTESRLAAALESARPSRDPGMGGTPPDPGEDPLAAALADELGISEAKVAAALAQLRPGAAPSGGFTTPGAGDGAPPSDPTTPDGSTAPSTGTTGATRS